RGRGVYGEAAGSEGLRFGGWHRSSAVRGRVMGPRFRGGDMQGVDVPAVRESSPHPCPPPATGEGDTGREPCDDVWPAPPHVTPAKAGGRWAASSLDPAGTTGCHPRASGGLWRFSGTTRGCGAHGEA